MDYPIFQSQFIAKYLDVLLQAYGINLSSL